MKFLSDTIHAFLLVLLSSLLLVVTSSTTTQPVFAAPDDHALQFLNLFKSATVPAHWKTEPLSNWTCQRGKCCPFDATNNVYRCTFGSNVEDELFGTLNAADTFTDPDNMPLGFLRIANRRLSGTFDFSSLPPSLSRLEMAWINLVGSTLDLATLPSGLVAFDLDRVRLDATVDLTTMGSSMRSFRVEHSKNMKATLNKAVLGLLPPSLNTILIRDGDSTGSFSFADLPRGLQHFSVISNSRLTITDARFSLLPRGLRRLHIGLNAAVSGELRIEDLPINMTNIIVRNTDCTSAEFNLGAMPRNMSYFYVETNKKLTATLKLGNLPDSLVQLRIAYNKLQGDLDLRNVNPNLQWLQCQSNDLSGRIIMPPTPSPTTDLWTEQSQMWKLQCGGNKMRGDLDGAALSRNLTELHMNDNRHDHFLNFDKLPPRLQILNSYRNIVMQGTLNDLSVLPRTLEKFNVYNNNLTGTNPGDLSTAPRKLSTISLQRNRFRGNVDFRNAPEALEIVHFFMNLFDGQVFGLGSNYPMANFSRLRVIQLGQNDLHGPLDLSLLGVQAPVLQQFTVHRNKFSGSNLNLNNLPASLEELHLHFNDFSNSLLDLNHLPRGLTAFGVQSNKLSGRVRLEFQNVPDAYRLSSDNFTDFCKNRVLLLNHIRDMPICNLSMTQTRSKSVSRSKNTVTFTRSISASRSRVDGVADWMLSVVLAGVTNKAEHWNDFPLREWECDGGNSGQQQQQKPSALCCPYNNNTMLYECSFSKLQGRMDIRFPGSYPLKAFSVTDSPLATGLLNISLMPSFLESLTVENTRVRVRSLPFGSLPKNIVNVSLCDNDFVGTATAGADAVITSGFSSSAGKQHTRLRTFRLCGGKLSGPLSSSFLSSLPASSSLETLDLSRQRFSGAFPWAALSHLSQKLKSLSIDGNGALSGDIDLSQLLQKDNNSPPALLQYFNASGNAFSSFSISPPSAAGFTVLAGFPALEVFDASRNQLAGANPNFGSLPGSLQYFSVHQNLLSGSPLGVVDKGALPALLRRFIISYNNFIGRLDMDVEDLASPFLKVDVLTRFCKDLLTGNRFKSSSLCKMTMSTSRSASKRSVSETISDIVTASDNKPSVTQATGTDTLSDALHTKSRDELSLSKSLNEMSNTSSASPTLSPPQETQTHRETHSVSISHELTNTSTIPVPVVPFERDSAVTGALVGGAIAAALTPSATAAALIVSRQTAVARAFGGDNGTCGGPTRSDPLDFFEDPFQFDFNADSCMGQLGGIFVGNVLATFLITAVIFLLHEYDQYRGKQNRLIKKIVKQGEKQKYAALAEEGAAGQEQQQQQQQQSNASAAAGGGGGSEGGNVLDNEEVAAALENVTCPTVLEGSKSGWPVEVLSVFGYGFLLPPAISALLVACVRCGEDWTAGVAVLTLLALAYLIYWLLFKRVRGEKCFPTRIVIHNKMRCWLFLKVIVYWFGPSGVWHWHGIASSSASASPTATIQNGVGDAEHTGEGGGERTDDVPLLHAQSSSSSPAAAASHHHTSAGENTTNSAEANQEPSPKAVVDNKNEDYHQELRFDFASRLLDKYVKKSWWFIVYELGIRALMIPAPAIAEAVAPQYSCNVMRGIYLLAVNALMIAVWGRRPYAHRALFCATAVATLAEIVILILLIVDSEAGEAVSPTLLVFSQILAVFLAVGVEVYMWLGERFYPAMLPVADGVPQKKRSDDVDDEDNDNGKAAAAAAADNDEDYELLFGSPINGGGGGETTASSSGDGGARRGLSSLMTDGGDDDDDDDSVDLFDRLDRRLRSAYRELQHEDIEIVPVNQRLQDTHRKFDEAFVGI